jgi:NTE family protein
VVEAGDIVSRALVLGGGGIAGIAWETGMLLGLAEAGVDVTGADRVIGTSAGSAVGAQITTGTPLPELFDRVVSGISGSTELDVEFDVEKLMSFFGGALGGARPGIEMNRAIGRMAIEAATVPEERRRTAIEARLPVHEWPDRDLWITAIDAGTGELRVFTPADAATGVSLVDAVCASCAVPGIWPAATIGTTKYIDGGVRATTNTDLAEGCDPVLVLAPLPDMPIVARVVRERAERLAASARVLTIGPDEASVAAIGMNPLDRATAIPSALAARAQAAAHVAEVRALWESDHG